MRGLSRVTDIVVLNILFLLCCIPVITAGASAAALYTMTLKMVRNEEPPVVKGFFRAFIENLKQGTLFGVLFTLAAAAIAVNFVLFGNLRYGVFQAVKVLSIAVGIVIFSLSLYIFPMIARFKMGGKEIFRNALLMSVAYLPKTLAMLAMYIPVLVIMFWSEMTMFVMLSVYVVFGFALMAFLKSFILRSIFSKYEKEVHNG